MFKDHLLNYVLNRLNVSNWFRLIKCDRCKYIVQKIWCSLHKTPSTHFHYDVREFVCCLQELEEFIINSNEVLSLVFDWDDSNSLLRILNVLNQIKDYEPSIKNLFPSLKKIIYMLMQYDIRIPKKCLNQVNHISYMYCAFAIEFNDISGCICAYSVFRFAGKMGRSAENGIND